MLGRAREITVALEHVRADERFPSERTDIRGCTLEIGRVAERTGRRDERDTRARLQQRGKTHRQLHRRSYAHRSVHVNSTGFPTDGTVAAMESPPVRIARNTPVTDPCG